MIGNGPRIIIQVILHRSRVTYYELRTKVVIGKRC